MENLKTKKERAVSPLPSTLEELKDDIRISIEEIKRGEVIDNEKIQRLLK